MVEYDLTLTGASHLQELHAPGYPFWQTNDSEIKALGQLTKV